MNGAPVISRVWAMPSADTFSIQPIQDFVVRHLRGVSIDPFARNCKLATYTNDLDPRTCATDHMKALDFLAGLETMGVVADTVLFDPPYSLRQAKDVYDAFGAEKFTQADGQAVGRWTKERDCVSRILRPGGTVLSFGWNSSGMGKKRGFELVEVLLVAHGSAHNDTICVAESRLPGMLDS